jgi:hypothetical protein
VHDLGAKLEIYLSIYKFRERTQISLHFLSLLKVEVCMHDLRCKALNLSIYKFRERTQISFHFLSLLKVKGVHDLRCKA